MPRPLLLFSLALAAHASIGLSACRPDPPPVAHPPTPSASAAPSDPLPPRPSLPTGPTVEVFFAHVGGERWIVDCALPQPVRAVAFVEGHVDRAAWRVLDPPGATIAGGFVVAPAPFARLRIEVPTNTTQPDKAYRPFYRYTDRGRLAYTGQLAMARSVCKEGDCAGGAGLSVGPEYTGTLTLLAAPGENVVVAGQSPAPRETIPFGDHATYAYFGDLAPVQTAGFTGVLDRGMPARMRDRVSEDLPRLFALYGERLGALDGPRPAVFLTFGAREHGVSIGGGVLRPHLVTLDLELDPAQLSDQQGTLLRIDRLVAHEAAHFWNDVQHTRGSSASAAWLDEGGADALAARALYAAGVLDDAAYRGILSEAASECALWLSGGEPLTALTRPGHARALYVCGSTLSLVAEAAARRHAPAADLFTFWKAVFDEGKPAYDEATFVHVLDRLGGAPAITAAVRRLVHDTLDDPTQAIRDTLRLAGVETAVVSQRPLPEEYEQHGSIPAMDALLPRACARALRFDGDVEVRPVVDADGACPGLAKGDVIEAMAGIPVAARGASSLQTAFAACRERPDVEIVTAARARVTVPCQRRAKVAPSYFEIVGQSAPVQTKPTAPDSSNATSR